MRWPAAADDVATVFCVVGLSLESPRVYVVQYVDISSVGGCTSRKWHAAEIMKSELSTVVPWFVFVSVAFVYVSTSYPSITGGDAGELVIELKAHGS